jgi:hypothetical protein
MPWFPWLRQLHLPIVTHWTAGLNGECTASILIFNVRNFWMVQAAGLKIRRRGYLPCHQLNTKRHPNSPIGSKVIGGGGSRQKGRWSYKPAFILNEIRLKIFCHRMWLASYLPFCRSKPKTVSKADIFRNSGKRGYPGIPGSNWTRDQISRQRISVDFLQQRDRTLTSKTRSPGFLSPSPIHHSHRSYSVPTTASSSKVIWPTRKGYMPRPSHSLWFLHHNNSWWRV